ASPGYLETHGTPESPDDLTTHKLIAFKEAVVKPLIGQDGEAGFFDPQAAFCRLVVDDGASQKIATCAGAGISVNSLWSVHRELKDGSLVRVLPALEVDDHSVLWLVYPKSNVLTGKVRLFIDFLLERIGRSPPWEQ
ncbi:MAG: LysR substrate-binding domain-containing protein, partial [Pseudomonadota bacterium]